VTRGRRVAALVPTLALVLSAAALAGWGGTGTAGSSRVLTVVPIVGDDGDAALFASTTLAPGQPVRRCITVSVDAVQDPSAVVLSAAAVSGALAPDLSVQVEVGSGGGLADCAGFAGTGVYSGPLAGLATGRWPTGWAPAGPGSRTFRVTVELPERAVLQGRTAGADLVWELVATGTMPLVPPTLPGVPPTATSVPPTATSAPVTSGPTGPATATTPASRATSPPQATGPTATTSTQEPSSTSRAAGGAGTSARGGSSGSVGRGVRGAATTAVAVARAVGAPGGVSLVLVLAMLLFFLVQRRLDERDPKLVHAPVRPAPVLAYEEPTDPGAPHE
jgi:hypothetical protein